MAHLLDPLTGGVLGIHRKRLKITVLEVVNTLQEVHTGYMVVLVFLLLVKVSQGERVIREVFQNGSTLTNTL